MGDDAAQVDDALYPRVKAYLESLPRGLRSYPECTAKASIHRVELPGLPVDPRRGGLPEPMLETLTIPPPNSSWIPEAMNVALHLAMADASPDETTFLARAFEMNMKLFSSPMYRMLIGFASPAILVKGASYRWGQFHAGTSVTASLGDHTAHLEMRFPLKLFPELMLRYFAEAFRAACIFSRGKDVRLELVEATTTTGAFDASWR